MEINDVKRVCLWSGPRNISTALMYSFAQRQDTKVIDEPLYGFYLKNTKAKEYHPGANEIIQSMDTNGKKVIDSMLNETSKPVLFYKHMTKHILDLDKSFLKNVINIILTRDPVEMITSFNKVIENPTMEDVGYGHHLEMVEYFKSNNIKFIVLDSKKVLLNPQKVLSQLCAEINIPFDLNMLSWEKGEREEDGVWAKYWYNTVHQSTGFQKYVSKPSLFPKHLIDLLDQCLPIYNELKARSIG